jgi:RNA polymerase sigma factor (sigma-70 family)
MTTQPTVNTLEPLVRVVIAAATGASATDAELLTRFIDHRDEAAFAALVHRHGSMVLGVCRRLLPNEADAEDVFQATFLVLALKAASVAPREMVAGWLHGVVRQVALRARRANTRRAARERQVAVLPEPESAPRDDRRDDLLPVLDRELSRLPDRYRTVLVLCDLEGVTRREAARELGLPEGTVNSRLSRARAMLTDRLTRCGVVLPSGALVAILAQSASAYAPASVVASTIRVAALVAETGTATTGGVSVGVANLTEGVVRTMFATKLKVAVAVLLVLTGLSFGGAWSFRALAGGEQRLPPTPAPAKDKTASKPEDNLKNTLLALDKHLWEASAKGDWQERAKFFAEDMVSISILGKYNRADNIAGDKRFRCSDWTIQDAEVVPTSKDTAVLHYRYSCKVTADDGTVETRKDYRATYVWANRNGGWVIVFCFDDHGRKGTAAGAPDDLRFRFKPNEWPIPKPGGADDQKGADPNRP